MNALAVNDEEDEEVIVYLTVEGFRPLDTNPLELLKATERVYGVMEREFGQYVRLVLTPANVSRVQVTATGFSSSDDLQSIAEALSTSFGSKYPVELVSNPYGRKFTANM